MGMAMLVKGVDRSVKLQKGVVGKKKRERVRVKLGGRVVKKR
jgi:hypothetical protein